MDNETGFTVLLIEDSPADVELVEHLAAHWQPVPKVITSCCLADGLKILSSSNIDIVLLDLSLPDSMGLETLARVLSVRHGLPVLVLTTLDDSSLAIEAIKMGAQDYLVKSETTNAHLFASIKYALERARIRQALADSQKRVASVIDSALDAVITIDAGSKILEWNRQAETIFGFRRSEVIGLDLCEIIIPPAQRKAHISGLKRFLATGQGSMVNRRVEVSALHRDGHEFPVELAICPVPQGEGMIFNGFLRDITDRRKLERRRAAEYALTSVLAGAESLFDATNDILKSICQIADCELGEMLVVDRTTGCCTPLDFWSKPGAALAEFCLAVSQLRLKPGAGFVNQVVSEAKAITLELSNEESISLPPELLERTGLRSVFGFPVKLGEEVLAVLLFFCQRRDPLTPDMLEVLGSVSSQIGQFMERKQAEENARQATAETQEARVRLMLMRQRDDFMAMLAHDLKTPILGADRLLALVVAGVAGPLSPEQSELLCKLRESNNSMLKMIYNLLDVYRFESAAFTLQKVEVDLPSLVRQCLGEVQALADDKRLSLSASFQEMPVEILADDWYMRRLVTNLLSNAVKFTPSGGAVEVSGHKDSGTVIMKIKDSGIGIPLEQQESIFHRFRQSDQRNRAIGSGLGLHLCRQIVEAHDGSLSVQSEPGKGTIFTVRLPAAGELP